LAQLLEEQRETWGTRGGFVLAAVGSAVGLGNLWGFPYKLYSYGGGAFLIPYITAMFCIGIPILILEFSLGHFTQRAAPDAFGRAHKKFEFAGWWGIILGFVIITYYPVILAYCFSFMKYSIDSIISGQPLPWAGEGIEGVENAKTFFKETYLNSTEGPALGAIQLKIVYPLMIAWTVMYFCIFRGIKFVGKIVWLTVPLPWLMLLVLTINGLMLPGSIKGLAYYLNPDWSELANPRTWQYAFGQAFFSLSLSYGVMITYASFLHRKSDINNNAAIIGLADFTTSFIAGLAIFATLGGMSFITAQAGNPVAVADVIEGGPGLAFVAFPYALAQLPAAPWWSFVFFFTLVTLGIDSAFSITESVLAAIIDKTGWKRSVVLPVMSLVGLGFGLVYVTQGGLNWLGAIDGFVNGTWGIAFLGMLECLLLGWLYRIENLRVHANERSDWYLGRWWNYAIRIFIPMVLGALFFWSLFNDVTAPEGFLRTPAGQWKVFDCVGMGIITVVPVIAVLMSMVKNPLRNGDDFDQVEIRSPIVAYGRLGGAVAIVLALVSAAIVGFVVVVKYGRTSLILPEMVVNCLVYQALGLGIAALILSNYILQKYDKVAAGPSWLARWAGIIATLDISAFIAVILITITSRSEAVDTTRQPVETLNGVSYMILSIVLLMIIGGLGYCFYRAMMAAAKDA
jgi:NSS family neurotransmitter:Na+ symporter